MRILQAVTYVEKPTPGASPFWVDLATVGNDRDDARPATLGANLVDSVKNLKALVVGDAAEDNMLLVPFLLFGKGEEELRAIRVETTVTHGEDAGARVLRCEHARLMFMRCEARDRARTRRIKFSSSNVLLSPNAPRLHVPSPCYGRRA